MDPIDEHINSNVQLVAGVADGYVVHNRIKPKKHRFKYQMCWCLFDVDKINQWVSRSRLWSYNGRAVYNLRDKDYVSDQPQSISEKIRMYLEQETKATFNGQIFLFTHPRFMGYGFNSVSFYFCYQNEKLRYIVSEINNTPWGEKHLYLHDCANATVQLGQSYQFNFSKQFHISPFMPMELAYSWDFMVTSERISMKMFLHQQGVNVLNVILDTKITPVVENGHLKIPLYKAFQPWKMSLGIYWQAIKLWFKKLPLYSHPSK